MGSTKGGNIMKYNTIPYWVNGRYNQNQRVQQSYELGIPVPDMSKVDAEKSKIRKKESGISINMIAIIVLMIFFLGELLIQAWDSQQVWNMLRM